MLTNVYQCLPSPQQLDQAIIPLQFHHGYSWIDLVDCFIMLIDPRIDIHELWKIKEIYEIYEYQHYNLIQFIFPEIYLKPGKAMDFLAQDFSVEIIWPPSGSPKIYSWLWNPWMKWLMTLDEKNIALIMVMQSSSLC